jgi:nicotinate phosphoribosyltransferase
MSLRPQTLYDSFPVEGDDAARWTDSYFTNARKCVEADGESIVTYAVFLRTPSMFAPRMVVGWLEALSKKEGFALSVETPYQTGDLVPAGYPQLYITGPLSQLSECETFILQKTGAVAVAALNAYYCCKALPDVPFIAMGARHCTGLEMQEMMDYAASVGGSAAQAAFGAKGFVAGASHATAHFFGREAGAGTMPHSLIGYYNSTLEAARRFRAIHPDKPFIVLNDYFGREVSDAIDVAKAFPQEAAAGTLSFRLDTNGARYLEGLDHDSSIEVIRLHAPNLLNEYHTESQLKMLYGMGVSVASVWYFRDKMREAGFPHVGIFGSSGFGMDKCRLMGRAKAPLNGVGTGSYIPNNFQDTYATADILRYGSDFRIKLAREYLIEHYKKYADSR